MKHNAPICIFVYKRLPHLRMTIESLQKNEKAVDSDVFIFSDGPPKNINVQDVANVRSYVRTISGFKSLQIIERDRNFGLANSIIDGVTQIVDQFGKVIVLEDDLVTSPYFLKYMNEALDKYEHEEKVISIHGYSYPTPRPLPETFFLRGTDCWGWATWKRGWQLFEPDSKKLLRQLEEKNLQHSFDFDGTYGYMKMLNKQISGKVDSWAVRWHASAFLLDKLTLFPGRSLVNNIGEGDSGTHTKSLTDFQTSVAQTPIVLADISIVEHQEARKAYVEFFRSVRPSLVRRALKKMRSVLSA
ncbi:MAG: glycosyltransferase [Ignavibacteriales bacterium]|nr:glycosyltransferase [Ignavibacteriales bacterium]